MNAGGALAALAQNEDKVPCQNHNDAPRVSSALQGPAREFGACAAVWGNWDDTRHQANYI